MSGRFVWHECFTTDVKGAIAFYTEVVGWKTQPFEADKPDAYTMWVSSQGPIGGVAPLPEQAKKMGAPPHWMGNVEVKDVDASVKQAQGLGAKVHVPPTPIPNVGRFAVIADPQGASLALVQFDQSMAPHDPMKPGEINWNELNTTDAPAALKFYSELFGWKELSKMDMGPMGTYYIFGQGDKQYGGMMNLTPEAGNMPPSWMYYINTDDLDAAMARATSKGAKTIYGPQEVPGGSRVANMVDPQGCYFALHGPGK